MLSGVSRPIYIAIEPVDMRKSFDGLAAIVKNHFHHDPLIGHLFVFINRSADRIKILYWLLRWWHKTTMATRFGPSGSKRDDFGRATGRTAPFPVAIIGEGKQVALVSPAQLAMILEGIEPVAIRKRKRFTLEKTGSN